ncbi:hypothetical protein KP509_01G054100 [Ceratopteris richardii]|nr:hypothetical protein KP509_01G054100 [Ceratopteris richardii]
MGGRPHEVEDGDKPLPPSQLDVGRPCSQQVDTAYALSPVDGIVIAPSVSSLPSDVQVCTLPDEEDAWAEKTEVPSFELPPIPFLNDITFDTSGVNLSQVPVTPALFGPGYNAKPGKLYPSPQLFPPEDGCEQRGHNSLSHGHAASDGGDDHVHSHSHSAQQSADVRHDNLQDQEYNISYDGSSLLSQGDSLPHDSHSLTHHNQHIAHDIHAAKQKPISNLYHGHVSSPQSNAHAMSNDVNNSQCVESAQLKPLEEAHLDKDDDHCDDDDDDDEKGDDLGPQQPHRRRIHLKGSLSGIKKGIKERIKKGQHHLKEEGSRHLHNFMDNINKQAQQIEQSGAFSIVPRGEAEVKLIH